MIQLHLLSTSVGFLRSLKNLTLMIVLGFIHQMDEKSSGEKFSPVILRSVIFFSSQSHDLLMRDTGDNKKGVLSIWLFTSLSHTHIFRHLCNRCCHCLSHPQVQGIRKNFFGVGFSITKQYNEQLRSSSPCWYSLHLHQDLPGIHLEFFFFSFGCSLFTLQVSTSRPALPWYFELAVLPVVMLIYILPNQGT
mgnify:CR=1 FL=1